MPPSPKGAIKLPVINKENNMLNRRSALRNGLLGAAAAAALGVTSTSEAATRRPRQYTFDIVIVGSGCAGLAAAIEAADNGARVALLEKMSMPFGNTIYAGGIFNATNTYVQKAQGLTDTVDAFYEDMMKVSLNLGNPELTRIFAEESASAIQWLTDRAGVRFKKIVTEVWPGLNRGHQVTGELKPGGNQLVKQLLDVINKSSRIKYFTNTKAVELLKTPLLECTGVRAISEDLGEVIFNAKGGVIMASGGFHANKEMVCKYMGGSATLMPMRGSPYMMGENIELTRPFFPYYANMDQFHGGPIHGPTQANPSTLVNYGLIVDRKGQRVIDEAKTYVEVAKELPSVTRDNWAYIIMDSAIVDIDTVAIRIDRYKRKNAPIYKGDTIESLAQAMQVDAKTLKATMEGYNRAVKDGKAADLTPANTLANPRPVVKPPFIALPFQGGMTATFGGPCINEDGQVINTEKAPVPGLYAAGNAIGGLFYWNYIVGSQLTAAVIFGRRAARNAAARAKEKKA